MWGQSHVLCVSSQRLQTCRSGAILQKVPAESKLLIYTSINHGVRRSWGVTYYAVGAKSWPDWMVFVIITFHYFVIIDSIWSSWQVWNPQELQPGSSSANDLLLYSIGQKIYQARSMCIVFTQRALSALTYTYCYLYQHQWTLFNIMCSTDEKRAGVCRTVFPLLILPSVHLYYKDYECSIAV